MRPTSDSRSLGCRVSQGSHGTFVADFFALPSLKKIQSIAALGIFASSVALAAHLVKSRKPPQTKPEELAPLLVHVAPAEPVDYTVLLRTNGEVKPRTQSAVVPEVSGAILEIGPNFREGGFFEKDELLLRLDDRDYVAAVTVTASAVATAQTVVEEESARAAQALEDWKRLGRTGEPSPLVARIPQIAEAKAKLDSAKAQLDQAQRDLKRTVLRAPFAGRVLEKSADLGQFISSGKEVGAIFSVDYAEVRLPLSNSQLAFIQLPESYRGDSDTHFDGPKVILRAEVAQRQCAWEGQIIRADGAVDSASRQLYVTAQIKDPYGRRSANQPPLKVGQWVDAEITGRQLKDVFVIPWSAVREGSEVLVVDSAQHLRRRKLTRIWSDQDHVVANAGLHAGDLLCTTALSYAVDGAKVKALRQPPAVEPPAAGQSPPTLQTGQPQPPPGKAES